MCTLPIGLNKGFSNFLLLITVCSPIKLDASTKEAVGKEAVGACTPGHYATVLVAVSTLNTLPNVILASLDINAMTVARIQVSY